MSSNIVIVNAATAAPGMPYFPVRRKFVTTFAGLSGLGWFSCASIRLFVPVSVRASGHSCRLDDTGVKPVHKGNTGGDGFWGQSMGQFRSRERVMRRLLWGRLR